MRRYAVIAALSLCGCATAPSPPPPEPGLSPERAAHIRRSTDLAAEACARSGYTVGSTEWMNCTSDMAKKIGGF
jgi:hypothetical protein